MKAIQLCAGRVVVSFWLLGASSAAGTPPPGGVVVWGYNCYGQTVLPAGLGNVVAIAGGGYHSLALKGDGTVVAWGKNEYDQTNVPAGLTNVVAIAGGEYHSLALRGDGTVLAWGRNLESQTNVPAGLTNVVAIAGGGTHSLALKGDGRVVAWGYNGSGQTSVPAGLTNVVAIAAGGSHSLALKGGGTVVAWGWNWEGQTSVPVGLTNVVAIAAGDEHSLALKDDGTVVAWGGGIYYPQNVPAGLTNVVAIAGGGYHNVALKGDGTVVAWGNNEYSQTNVPAGLTNVVAIAGGGFHSLAITLAPAISSEPPTTVWLAPGAGISLSVTAWSSVPFSCQWAFNGRAIPAATGSTLVITNFDLTKAGAYSLLVSNQYGYAAASSVLRLTNSPVVLVDGADVGGGTISRVDSSQVTMSSTFGSDAEIYYTLDGSEPDFTRIPYSGAFTVTNSTTIRAIAYDFLYTDWAEAAPIYVQIWPTYPLSVSTPGGGSVNVSPDPYSAGNRYVSNSIVTLTALPADGWSFVRWTGDCTLTTNVATVLMDRPRTVQAIFGTSLSLFTNGSGQVVLSPPNGPYPFGSTVQLTALPSQGYYFFGWAGAASGFANPLFITATNGAGITALFGALNANQVSLTVLPNGDGSVSVSPSKNVYANGETVTLTAVPASNHVFSGWSGGASGNLNPLGLTLTASTVITADFAPGSPTNPPVITQPPLSRTLSPGASTLLSFGLTADGPLSYQWRLNSSPLAGATNPSLALTGVTPTQAGVYDVIVSGPGGAATSAPACVALFGLEWAQGVGGGRPLLVLDAAPNLGFRLEYSWDLSPTNWHLLAPVTLQDKRLYYIDSVDTNFFRRFYRASPQ